MTRTRKYRFLCMIMLVAALAGSGLSCGGKDKGSPLLIPPFTPTYNHYLAGTYEVHIMEQEYTDVNVRRFTATADGSGNASVSIGGGGTMTARYSISSDRSISLGIPSDPSAEPSSGVVSADGSIAVLADTNLSGPGNQFDVEIAVLVRKTTGMTAQKASGEYILCEVGKASSDTYNLFAGHSMLIVRDDGTGSLTGLSRSEGMPAPKTEITFQVADNGTFTANIGGVSYGGIVSPDAGMIVMTDTGEVTDVSFAVGVRRSPWTMPAFGGSFQEIVVGHEMLVSGPQFTSRSSAYVHEIFPQLYATTIADSRGTPAGTTNIVEYSPKDDGMLYMTGHLVSMSDPPYGIVSPDGGLFIAWDTSRNTNLNDYRIALLVGVQTVKAPPPSLVSEIPPYQFFNNDAGDLVAVNVFEAMDAPPLGPGETSRAAKSVASGVEVKSIVPFTSGAYSAATKMLSDQKMRSVLYAADGRLHRISALGGSSLLPMQISSETGAAGICTTLDVVDYTDHGNSLYLYQLAGAVGGCEDGDEIWRAVRLNMTASDPPLEITSFGKMPVGALYDPSTAGRIGLIVMDIANDKLERCTPDLGAANCALISDNVTNASMLGIDVAAGKVAIWTFSGSAYSVRVYDPTLGTLSGSIYEPAFEPGESIQDTAGSIYFFEGARTVKKLTFGAVPGVSTLLTETDDIIDAKLTSGRFVYLTRSETDNGDGTYTVASAIRSVTLSGLNAQELATMTDTVTWPGHRPLELYTTAVNAIFSGVYYNKKPWGSAPTAGYIYDDRSGPDTNPDPPQRETADAEWTALSWGTTTQLPAEGAVDRIIMSTGESVLPGPGSYWDAVPYDAATYGQMQPLISIADSDYFAGLRGRGIGNFVLCTAMRISNSKSDIFLISKSAARAFQITDTADINEVPIGK